MSRHLIFVLCGCLLGFSGFAQQNNNDLVQSEKELSLLLNNIVASQSVSKSDSLNDIFTKEFKKALSIDGALKYPFDSLKQVGKLFSPDSNLRIFTWNIPQAGGLQCYYGFVLVRTQTGVVLHQLTDSRLDKSIDVHHAQLSDDKWLGALYYNLISVEGEGYYILFGYDYNNLFSSKKIIEVLSVKPDGNISFGLPVFSVDNKYVLSRIVFEFNVQSRFTLQYLGDDKMIIFDHLSPIKSEFAGDPQFYGPDGSFDGFKFEKGKWTYVRDLDLRNPQRDKPKPVQAPETDKEPGFLYKPMKVLK